MGLIWLMIIGAGAGFLATGFMKIEADVPTTVAVGVFGALIGAGVLRLLIWSLSAAAGFLGALLGALALLFAYKMWKNR